MPHSPSVRLNAPRVQRDRLYRADIIVPRIKALDREHVTTSSERTSNSPTCADTSRSACPATALAAFRGSLTFLALRY